MTRVCVCVSQMATFLSAAHRPSVGLIWRNNNTRWEQEEVRRVAEGGSFVREVKGSVQKERNHDP